MKIKIAIGMNNEKYLLTQIPKKKQAQEVVFSTKFHSPDHPDLYNLTVQYITNLA